jgi:hypothetical protein
MLVGLALMAAGGAPWVESGGSFVKRLARGQQPEVHAMVISIKHLEILLGC